MSITTTVLAVEAPGADFTVTEVELDVARFWDLVVDAIAHVGHVLGRRQPGPGQALAEAPGLQQGPLGLDAGTVHHRHAAPAECRHALLNIDAGLPDRLLDGLRLQRYGAGLEGATLTESQIPSHVHNNVIVDAGHQHTYQNASLATTYASRSAPDGNFVTSGTPGLTSLNGTGISINNVAAGGGQAHNNVQPFLVVNKIIKT